ncbi:DUF3667 domain-containing protein [Sphingopyxis macrogoltabida]|uniref:DUF3667 domain-containing protein n=1 Tax=Sphingopyxis macrogoltabida TaxID=33050 RepID=A0AAC9AX90_SPHMC|nr:DUF3667 domain-containing protein [Sphingopyxis macrogoltabida]ALJ15112.1 hypothetical protein LH19_19750 [Sphingopyxis macrogoltabida]AMU91359.1 hypothetical protein ATM17_20300 [Sphingopyxis macrogoltabida]
MSGDIEAIGAAVTAGLAGHAVEPRHGGDAAHGGARCLNCGTSLAGSHCHHCGQKADIHRSFGAIGHDLVHAIFHFEGKIWNTLPLLVWRPGDLTRRYIHGERARFISPLALFLFAVFLTYAVLAMVGSGGGVGEELSKAAAEQTRTAAIKDSMQQEVDRIDAELAKPGLAAGSRRELETERDVLQKSADYLGVARSRSKTERAADRAAGPPVLDDPAAQIKTSADFISQNKYDTGVAFIDHGLAKAFANPALVLYKLQANAYKFAWALIPLSLPFMWLLYPFSRRFHTYDHFVFVTYSISFMLLLFVVVRLFNLTLLGEIATFCAMLYAPFHMYRQIRGAYRASWFGALARTTLLLFFSLFAVITFMLLLLALGVMG